jgi:NAD/NADP transhydrogenase alpha subunit
MDTLTKASAEVWVETGAGVESGLLDADYSGKGAKVASAAEVREKAQILLTCAGTAGPEERPNRDWLL